MMGHCWHVDPGVFLAQHCPFSISRRFARKPKMSAPVSPKVGDAPTPSNSGSGREFPRVPRDDAAGRWFANDSPSECSVASTAGRSPSTPQRGAHNGADSPNDASQSSPSDIAGKSDAFHGSLSSSLVPVCASDAGSDVCSPQSLRPTCASSLRDEESSHGERPKGGSAPQEHALWLGREEQSAPAYVPAGTEELSSATYMPASMSEQSCSTCSPWQHQVSAKLFDVGKKDTADNPCAHQCPSASAVTATVSTNSEAQSSGCSPRVTSQDFRLAAVANAGMKSTASDPEQCLESVCASQHQRIWMPAGSPFQRRTSCGSQVTALRSRGSDLTVLPWSQGEGDEATFQADAENETASTLASVPASCVDAPGSQTTQLGAFSSCDAWAAVTAPDFRSSQLTVYDSPMGSSTRSSPPNSQSRGAYNRGSLKTGGLPQNTVKTVDQPELSVEGMSSSSHADCTSSASAAFPQPVMWATGDGRSSDAIPADGSLSGGGEGSRTTDVSVPNFQPTTNGQDGAADPHIQRLRPAALASSSQTTGDAAVGQRKVNSEKIAMSFLYHLTRPKKSLGQDATKAQLRRHLTKESFDQDLRQVESEEGTPLNEPMSGYIEMDLSQLRSGFFGGDESEEQRSSSSPRPTHNVEEDPRQLGSTRPPEADAFGGMSIGAQAHQASGARAETREVWPRSNGSAEMLHVDLERLSKRRTTIMQGGRIVAAPLSGVSESTASDAPGSMFDAQQDALEANPAVLEMDVCRYGRRSQAASIGGPLFGKSEEFSDGEDEEDAPQSTMAVPWITRRQRSLLDLE